jgi:DNA-directed RNA polymerase specialized sigma24 family protein
MSDTYPGDTGVRDNAYDAFFRREYPVMVSLGVALTGDPELARDVAQESMLRLTRPLGGGRFEPGRRPERVVQSRRRHLLGGVTV